MPSNDWTVAPGQRISGVLETAAYRSGIKVGIPVVVMRGAKDGPALTVLAGQHGRELNGIEANSLPSAVGQLKWTCPFFFFERKWMTGAVH